MITVERLQTFFWDIDPGYFRLKHAFKTVLAIMLTLIAVRNEPILSKLMASTACGLSMQGVVARNFYLQIIHVIFFNLVYFFVAVLGLSVHDHPDLKALLFIVLAFAVNYIRRFGLQASMTPMMIWVLCFMATNMSSVPLEETLAHIHGLIAGLVIGGLVYLLVFPEDYPRLFIANSNRLFRLLAEGLYDVRRYLLTTGMQPFERENFVVVKRSLNRMIESNYAMLQSEAFAVRQTRFSETMVHMYALVHAYSMMLDSYRLLKIHDYKLSPAFRLVLSRINRDFVRFFSSVKIDENYTVTTPRHAVSLAKINEQFSRENAQFEPSLIMALLNLKLSFALFNEHSTLLMRGANAATK
ncbi:hypothetical protein ACFORL_02885 [Legionella dresdenensis]|uniref:FUSC family protein n=1 Tax=Legionella dresdenensis TaxID=450200 RepID=A0ABV8CCI8_9GAMM